MPGSKYKMSREGEKTASHVNFKYFESKASEIDLSKKVEAERKKMLSVPVTQLEYQESDEYQGTGDCLGEDEHPEPFYLRVRAGLRKHDR